MAKRVVGWSWHHHGGDHAIRASRWWNPAWTTASVDRTRDQQPL